MSGRDGEGNDLRPDSNPGPRVYGMTSEPTEPRLFDVNHTITTVGKKVIDYCYSTVTASVITDLNNRFYSP